MLHGFGYLYKFISLFFFSSQKAENNRLKKETVGQNFVTIFLLLLKSGSVGPVD